MISINYEKYCAKISNFLPSKLKSYIDWEKKNQHGFLWWHKKAILYNDLKKRKRKTCADIYIHTFYTGYRR